MNPTTPVPLERGACSPEERRWLRGFALVVLVVLSLPFILGSSYQGAQSRFSGFVLGVEDGNSYIAKMRLGSEGAWLFKTPYTTAEQKGVVAFLPYLILGKLAGGDGRHEQLVALFHLFRLVAGWLFIHATFDFIAFFIDDRNLRRLGLLLITLGGGLGWVLLVIGQSQFLGTMPLEFYSPESFGFLSLFTIPHLAFGRAVMLWGVLEYLRACQQPGLDRLRVIKTGLLWLLACLAQPLYGLIFGFVLFCHQAAVLLRGLAQREKPDAWIGKWISGLRIPVGAFLIPMPFLVYNFIMFSTDPFLKTWTGQNIILSPHPAHYLLAFGLVLPFALGGVRQAWIREQSALLMLGAWVVLFPVLAYLPFNLQRRLPEGVWVAFVILALTFLEPNPENPKTGWRRKLSWLFIFAFPSTLVLLAGSMLTATQPDRVPVFRPAAEVRAFEFLDGYSESGEVVLTSFPVGNVFPAWADLRVVIGHGPESVGLLALQPQVNAFYRQETQDDARLKLIREQNIRYVFESPGEATAAGWSLASLPYLTILYQQDGYTIYELSAGVP